MHYEGWSHFHEGRAAIERVWSDAPARLRESARWVPIGEVVTLTV